MTQSRECRPTPEATPCLFLILQLMPGQSFPLAPQLVLSHQYTEGINLSLRWQYDFSLECNSPTQNPYWGTFNNFVASQASSHPALLLNLQGTGLHQEQICFSLGIKPQDIRSKFSIARNQIHTSYSRPRVSFQAKRRYKLFHLKSLGSFVHYNTVSFLIFIYLAQVPSFVNKCADFSIIWLCWSKKP